MAHSDAHLTRLARSVVEPLGYELVGVEYFQRGKLGGVLRVYIDHADGITLDDCAAVSRQLSGVLDVEDPIKGHYDLEVSSPGLDRPLFGVEQYERFRGHRAKVRLAAKLEGRRNFAGVLAGVDQGALLLEEDGETIVLPLEMIESARLVPEF
jgi:ribosome maturation factor RimP